MNFLKTMIATFFGAGLSPYAPGTMGTLAAALMYCALIYMGWASFVVLVCLLIISSVLTVWVGNWAEQHFQTKDPHMVVLDEVAGFLLTVLLWLPSWRMAVAGFLLFRVFDILKPYPIKKCEELPGGWGILIDDLAAGVYATLVIALIHWLDAQYAWGLGFMLRFNY